MHTHLHNNLFLIKEHLGLFKASNNYDIYDPNTGAEILECREKHLGLLTKIFRFTDYKRFTPFHLFIQTPDGTQVLRIRKGISALRAVVQVYDEHDQLIGMFKEKFISLGGAFRAYAPTGEELFQIKGSLTSWNFSIKNGEEELGIVRKKWNGIGKEFFTSADNYILEIPSTLAPKDPRRQLILAAVMCIDMVIKE